MQRKKKCMFMICLWIFLGIYSMGCQKKEDVILPSKEIENVSKETENTAKEQTQQGTKEAEKPKMITVYVCGEIQNPDVYELPQTARIYDAIEAAGGMKETAAKDALKSGRAACGWTADKSTFERRSFGRSGRGKERGRYKSEFEYSRERRAYDPPRDRRIESREYHFLP